MDNFAKDIEDEAGGEPIHAIVIGEPQWWKADPRDIPTDHIGIPIPWSVARPLLDYNYNTNYGSADCHAIAAYTETRVILVGTYDGATWLYSVMRNPTPGHPSVEGGG